jgi:hypothetical protein
MGNMERGSGIENTTRKRERKSVVSRRVRYHLNPMFPMPES